MKLIQAFSKAKFNLTTFINKNSTVVYDDIENCADAFTNNQFIGKWISYKEGVAKKCNWGDYRMPDSGNFDGGAGEFSPMTTDASLGWKTYQEQWLTYHNKSTPKAIQARKIEEAKWWQ